MGEKSIIIIGAGFAGLCTGIYGQMNGYQTQIFEMHKLPGGLCTAWQRKGYTIDSCIHWLCGTNPIDPMHRMWEEVGLAQGREFINIDEYMRYESADGRTLILYSDADKLEKHLLELAPQDADTSRNFIEGIRQVSKMLAGQPADISKWMNPAAGNIATRFTDPLLREVIGSQGGNFMLMLPLAYQNNKDAGYPIGGSLPMSKALEKRYLELGGIINYNSRVEKILVKDNKAVGIKLDKGQEFLADRVISAADGYNTIFKMLNGKYADGKTREPYEKWQPFPALIYVGIGVHRSFADEPKTVSGFSFPLKSPTEIGDNTLNRLSVHLYNQDPTMAPPGKTSVVIMINSKIEYWQDIAKDHTVYKKKKKEIGKTIVQLLEQRFPGISKQVEMIDVATPLTWVRYTGNWKGSYEGWLPSPQNAMMPMSKTLPGLYNFYMVGQWVQPGGGLPTGLMHGREIIQTICRLDNKEFTTTLP